MFDASWMSQQFIWSTGILVLSLWILFRGLRGRRIDDHPVCRACGYDQSGRPANSTNCPECGRDVSLPGQIRIGTTRRRSWLVVIGLLLSLISAAVLAPAVTRVPWVRLEPSRLLFHQLQFANAGRAQSSGFELERRMDMGTLDSGLMGSEIDSLTKTTLKNPDAFDYLVVHAELLGQIQPSQWTAYCTKQCVALLLLREQVRRGSALPVYSGASPSPAWAAGYASSLQLKQMTLDIDGNAVDASFLKQAVPSRQNFMVPNGLAGLMPSSVVARLPDGHHTMHAHCDYDLSIALNGKRCDAVLHYDLPGDFAVLPPTTQTVSLVLNPALRTQVANAFGRPIIVVAVNGSVSVEAGMNYIPTTLVYRVILRTGGREFDLGPTPVDNPVFLFRMEYSAVSKKIGLGGAQTADVILRPDRELAEQSLLIDKIWGEDVVIPNVPIIRKR